jgi:truncated hemoglobin YjbI
VHRGQAVLRAAYPLGFARSTLEGFRKSRDFSGFFAAVKPFVDDIEEMRHYALTPDGSDPPKIRSPRNVPTLYQWAGEIERIEALFKRFYERVALDPTLRPVFAEMPAQHFQTVAHFVAEVLGGSNFYSGDGQRGHATMVAKHLGRNLSEAERKRWVELRLDTPMRSSCQMILSSDQRWSAIWSGALGLRSPILRVPSTQLIVLHQCRRGDGAK